MIATASAEEFHAAVAATSEKPLVVFFSSSGCGGCTIVAPKMATLAEELAPSATFLTVSAEALNALCEEVAVESFPHFRVYKETKIVGDFTSSKVDKVDAFIRERIAPDTLEEVPETEEKEEEVVMDCVSKEEGSKKRQEREEMQDNDEHIAKKSKVEERAEKAEEIAETREGGSKVADEVVMEAPETMIGSTEVTETTDVPSEVTDTTDVPSEVTETTDVPSEITEKKLEDAVSGDTMDSSDVAAAATA